MLPMHKAFESGFSNLCAHNSICQMLLEQISVDLVLLHLSLMDQDQMLQEVCNNCCVSLSAFL